MKKKQSLRGGLCPGRHFQPPFARLYNVTGDTCYSMVAYNICNYNVPVNIFTEEICVCFSFMNLVSVSYIYMHSFSWIRLSTKGTVRLD